MKGLTLRTLYTQRPLRVEADPEGWPAAVHLGGRTPVRRVQDRWLVEEGWWRPEPVRRMYFQVELEDGQVLVLYRDLRSGEWFRQPYSGPAPV
jgi:hypothetical protein